MEIARCGSTSCDLNAEEGRGRSWGSLDSPPAPRDPVHAHTNTEVKAESWGLVTAASLILHTQPGPLTKL